MKQNMLKEEHERWKYILNGLISKIAEKLIDNGYDSDLVGKIMSSYKPKMEIINGEYIMYYNDDIIAKSNGSSDLMAFINEANKNLIKWFINKMNINMNEDKKTISLTESQFKNLIKESVKSIINEISNSSLKKSYINKLYKITHDITSHIYKDDDWRNVNHALSIIEDFVGDNGEVSVWCENGGYWKQINEFPNYKEYKIKIALNNNIEINGSLKCHSAGTIDDPFSRYDMTITFW